jgi:hypothetical protein
MKVLNCIAASNMEDPSPELESTVPQRAAALAEAIRALSMRSAEERLQSLHARLAETQAAFDESLQQHQFCDAAYSLAQLRREVDDEQVYPTGVLDEMCRCSTAGTILCRTHL